MILLALAKTGGHFEKLSINNQRTAIIFIRCLPSTTYFPKAKLSSTFLPSLFWKNSKTFHQQPESMQRLSRLQNCLSRKASTGSSNQQHQLAAAAVNSSNQQQQSTASTSSNQHQQPAATTSISNQHSSYQQHLHNQRRPPLVITTVPSEGYPASS